MHTEELFHTHWTNLITGLWEELKGSCGIYKPEKHISTKLTGGGQSRVLSFLLNEQSLTVSTMIVEIYWTHDHH